MSWRIRVRLSGEIVFEGYCFSEVGQLYLGSVARLAAAGLRAVDLTIEMEGLIAPEATLVLSREIF